MSKRTILKSLAEKVQPAHAAVVVIDFQNEFCHPDGFFGREGYDLSMIQAAAANTAVLLDSARRARVPIVHVRSVYDDHYVNEPMDERSFRRGLGERGISGTWATEFYQVVPLTDEPVVTKHRYSAFQYTDLEAVLQALGVRTLVVTGCTTNVCVESTIRDGYFHGYYIVAVDDCIGTTNEDRLDLKSEEIHSWTMTNVELTFGVVATADEVVRCWPAGS